MSEPRKHFSVEQLPDDLVETIRAMVIDGKFSYSTITEHVRALGADVSRSAIARYGKALLTQRFALESTAHLAKELLKIDVGDLETLATRLAIERIAAVLISNEEIVLEFETLSLKEFSQLVGALARLQATGLARDKWHREIAEREALAADEVARTARRGGLSPDTVEEIRRRVLGLGETES